MAISKWRAIRIFGVTEKESNLKYYKNEFIDWCLTVFVVGLIVLK
jgi:hypothetical protein